MEGTITVNAKDATYTGILFQLQGKRTDEYTDDELWAMAKKEALKEMEFPYTAEMPCGNKLRFDGAPAFLCLSVEDVPCPCGNSKHWMIRYRDLRGNIQKGG